MAAAEAAWRCLSQCEEDGQLTGDKLAAADLACKHLRRAIAKEEDGPSVPDCLRPMPSVLVTLVKNKSVSALRLIGALALHSLASNRALAQQEGLIHTLVACLADAGSGKVLEACVNALSDLATSDEGSAALVAQGALPVLMDRLIDLAPTCPTTPRKRKRRASNTPTALFPLLDAIFALLFCQAAPAIGELPRGRSSLALEALSSATSDAEIRGELSPKQTAKVCALAARFSLEGGAADFSFENDVTASAEAHGTAIEEARSGFGTLVGFGAAGLGGFLQTVWEQRPAFFPADTSKEPEADGRGFPWPLSGVKGSEDSEEFFEFLEGAVGCPSPAAEECDVITALREASEELGGPLVYGRDVTLVKTVAGQLVHFDGKTGQSGSASEAVSKVGSAESARTDVDGPGGSLPVTETNLANPRFVSAGDCREAFKNGFSVAVRGLQCRISEIAQLANNMALALGQAGVGVNAYLTPANSQGLAAHYDDHCVFVCQLAGSKLWRLYEPLESEQMPRLYAPRLEPELAGSICSEFKMRKGDVLYIPRGWTHVATALDVESLHVTFGVEVEEPFSWEGFLNAAVQAATLPVDLSGFPSEQSVEVPPKCPLSMRDPVSSPSGGGHSEKSRVSSGSVAKSGDPRPCCRCYEAVHVVADSIPELRKACLLGAVQGSGSLASSISNEPERNRMPAEVAHRSALRVAKVSEPSHSDGFGASNVKWNEDPEKSLASRPLGKSNIEHISVFESALDTAVSQIGVETKATSASTALGDFILTEAAVESEFEYIWGRVRAQALGKSEKCADRRLSAHLLEKETLQKADSSLSSNGSDGQAAADLQAEGKNGSCSGCIEAARFGTGKKQYLQRLREYQKARRLWTEAMIAVQSFLKGYHL
ncbi:hypothetical protein KFL_001640080 [Klebsormidium nitens]|uniref:Bifunctional lysine-specific demethylase and histidyl-hydroxylase n=1 Tax=Klebsormidium nitens TaxID=105231 RepID=A0A0U9HSF1_KLENI|nr:hypothetical protein KFL_001640080 [Klebsormidium nitens]|eukprot:GAQ83833.1 hypothetical protein KFL_001640080 [Klebsormidium nitens]